MTTRILSGTYLSGYTLAGSFSAVFVTASGDILGAAGATGTLNGTAGGAALTLPASVTARNSGFITGGAGGDGADQTYNGGAGGSGGAGISLAAGGIVTNTQAVYGGKGGHGGAATQGGGGAGGTGGDGVWFGTSGILVNTGVIQGGAGGSGGTAKYTGAASLGGAGVFLKAGGTILNTGEITAGANGSGAGVVDNAAVVLMAGGAVVNGSSTNHTARIGGDFGVLVFGKGATVRNFGEIDGYTSFSVQLGAGGRFVAEAGSLLNGAAYGDGGTLELATGTGTIAGLGGTVAVSGATTGQFEHFGTYALDAGGTWTLSGANALASGKTLTDMASMTIASAGVLEVQNGALFSAQGQITNSGIIALESSSSVTELKVLAGGATLGGTGVLDMLGPRSRIVAAKSGVHLDVLGTIYGGGLISGVYLINHVGAVMEAAGPQALTVDTQRVVNAGLMEATSGATLVLEHVAISQQALWGTIAAQSGGIVDLADAVIFGGTVSQAGTGIVRATVSGGELDGASAASGPVNLAGVIDVLNGVALTLDGTIANTGALDTLGTSKVSKLIIGVDGVTLTGGGQINLDPTLDNQIVGTATSEVLTNLDNHIAGAGLIGGGGLSLVNRLGGTISGDSAATLTLDTGAATISNAGVIESAAAGQVVVKSALANGGNLIAASGTLTLEGAVTGTGFGRIKAGVLNIAATFGEDVSFLTGATGVLRLADWAGFTGEVSGLSTTGKNAIDLIGFTVAGAKATYSGTTASGVLTVSNGSQTVKIGLIGNYLGHTFTVTFDGHGGVTVKDPPAASAGLAQAMAAFATPPAATLASRDPGRGGEDIIRLVRG